MKQFLIGLVMCTMLLCISTVSYGADGAEITKSEVSFNTDIDVTYDVVTVSEMSFSYDVVTDIGNDSTSYAIASTPLVYRTVYIDDEIHRDCYSYINNYKSFLATETEPDQYGSYPSNHVGKLLANHLKSITLESATNVGYKSKLLRLNKKE